MTLADIGYVATGSGLLLPEAVAVERARQLARPTAVDLFCGAGGMSLGAIAAGFEVVCGVDNDFYPALTYLTNLGQWPMTIAFVTAKDRKRFEKGLNKEIRKAKRQPDDGRGPQLEGDVLTMPVAGSYRPPDRTPVRTFIFGDVRKLTGDVIAEVSGVPIGEVHTVFGAPPCQGFSTSGKRNIMDRRNSLVFEMARLICELRPTTFVFENVPGITTMVTPEGVPVLDQFCRIVSEGGWAEYEALVRMMGANPDAAAAFRGGKVGSKARRQKKEPKKADKPPQDEHGNYRRRYCFEHAGDAITGLLEWDGQGDPPGPWLVEKPGDRLGPGLID